MWFGYLILVFAPGAWITCGPSFGGLPLWSRLATGATLSPLVVCGEFYLLRLLGLPFQTASVALVFLNLPALLLALRWRDKLPPRRTWVVATAAVLIPAACLAEYFIYTDVRIYSPHAWVYADPVYMLERGDLVLEDPTLAGARLAYPVWSALVFQAVSSFLLNSPPVLNYIWGNLLWLILIYGFAAGIAKEMGGGRLAQISAGVFLFLGSNPVGYFLGIWTPSAWRHYRLWGDSRYTPWVSKFDLFSTMPLGLGLLMAMIYLLVRQRLTRQVLVLLCLLACGIGVLYPLLLPPAFGVVCARMAALRIEKCAIDWRKVAALGGVLATAALAAGIQVHLLTAQRHASTAAVQFSTVDGAMRKAVAGILATSLFLAGLSLVLRRCWKSRPVATATLVGGALASYGLHSVFSIPYWDNEYKFIFSAAMCLAVFPSLAAERIWREWPRMRAIPALAGAFLLVLAAFAHLTWQNWHMARKWDAGFLDARRFHLDLQPGRPWAEICKAARLLTAPDTLLLAARNPYYFPQLTARSLYVPAQNLAYPGVTLFADDLLAGVRGYGQKIVDERRERLLTLFAARDAESRARALDPILALKRPLALILEPEHAALLAWLEGRRLGHAIFRDGGVTLWLIPPV